LTSVPRRHIQHPVKVRGGCRWGCPRPTSCCEISENACTAIGAEALPPRIVSPWGRLPISACQSWSALHRRQHQSNDPHSLHLAHVARVHKIVRAQFARLPPPCPSSRDRRHLRAKTPWQTAIPGAPGRRSPPPGHARRRPTPVSCASANRRTPPKAAAPHSRSPGTPESGTANRQFTPHRIGVAAVAPNADGLRVWRTDVRRPDGTTRRAAAFRCQPIPTRSPPRVGTAEPIAETGANNLIPGTTDTC